MNISDEQKEHLKLVVENMKNINMDEYNRYNEILNTQGFDKAYKYVFANSEGKVDGFTHSKQQSVSHFSVMQKFPSRISCPGHAWSISNKQVKKYEKEIFGQ